MESSLPSAFVEAQQYKKILQKYGAIAEADLPKQAISQDTFTFNNVTISLYFQPDIAPEGIHLRAEVMDIEEGTHPHMIHQCLVENLGRYHQNDPIFALAPDMKRMVALAYIPLSRASAPQLETIITKLANDITLKRMEVLSGQTASKTAPVRTSDYVTHQQQSAMSAQVWR
jgi:hypothetical protein